MIPIPLSLSADIIAVNHKERVKIALSPCPIQLRLERAQRQRGGAGIGTSDQALVRHGRSDNVDVHARTPCALLLLAGVAGGRNGERLRRAGGLRVQRNAGPRSGDRVRDVRSEEHTSELQSLMRISYAVFCLKKKKRQEQI